jgi:hypothetical protein
MACCAFAVFLLTQLLVPFRWVHARIFGEPRSRPNAAVAWSPEAAKGGQERKAGGRSKAFGRGVAIAASLELLLMTGAVFVASDAVREPPFIEALHTSICHGLGIVD